jgi:single-strand DNA-binding protein
MEIIGRVTADATVTNLKDDRKVINFTVAINDSYKPKNSSEWKKTSTFVQCSYWLNALIVKHLTKGSLVELSGRIGVNAYKGFDGEPKATLTFHVNAIKIHAKSKGLESNAEKSEAELADSLPF